MPAPPISSQPECLQTRHPVPSQMAQSTAKSTPGSTNGEEVAAEADLAPGTEELACHLVEHAFEIGQGDVFIDRQTFELMEHPLVGGILRFIAIGAARNDHPDRRESAPSPAPASERCGSAARFPHHPLSTRNVSQTSRAGWSEGMLS